MQKISCLSPLKSNQQDWLEIIRQFPNVISTHEFHIIYDEITSWHRKLKDIQNIFMNSLNSNKTQDLIEFYKNSQLANEFPLIFKFSRALLSLPHSSAEVERIFSQLKLIKNDKRNKLAPTNLETILTLKYQHNMIDFKNEIFLDKIMNRYDDILSAKAQKKRESRSANDSSNIYRKNSNSELNSDLIEGKEEEKDDIKNHPIIKKLKFNQEEKSENELEIIPEFKIHLENDNGK